MKKKRWEKLYSQEFKGRKERWGLWRVVENLCFVSAIRHGPVVQKRGKKRREVSRLISLREFCPGIQITWQCTLWGELVPSCTSVLPACQRRENCLRTCTSRNSPTTITLHLNASCSCFNYRHFSPTYLNEEKQERKRIHSVIARLNFFE